MSMWRLWPGDGDDLRPSAACGAAVGPPAPVFRVLGRVEVGRAGHRIDIRRRRERCLLGVLLLRAGSVVEVDRLVDLLWDAPPPTARPSLHTHVARLRNTLRALPADCPELQLVNVDGGYLLDTDRNLMDVHQFVALVTRARATEDLGDRAALLEAALALWRGPVIAADASPRLRDRISADVTELRAVATELLVSTNLARGLHREVVGVVTQLSSEQPHNERITAMLMVALYRSGRQADALAAFERIRLALGADLGVDPGPELQQLRVAVLRHDAALLRPW